MNVLGLNFFHPNASAAILVDGELVAAAEEERFNRVKSSAGMPYQAIQFCLQQAGLTLPEVDVVTHARCTNTRVISKDLILFQDPVYKIESPIDGFRIGGRLLSVKRAFGEALHIDPSRLKFQFREMRHHLSHMLSGYVYSPFEEAIVLSADSFGDFVALDVGIARGNRVESILSFDFPHSLGLFYTMITHFLGFPKYGDEAKVMGLATCGYPEYRDRLRSILSFRDGRLNLNLEFFDAETGVQTGWWREVPDISRLCNGNLRALIGESRSPGEEILQRHRNVAASLQSLTEEIIFQLVEYVYKDYPIPNLVFTGGLAFNSLLNGRLTGETSIESLYVPPAPGNAGLSIGSALAFLGDRVSREIGFQAFLGPEYSSETILAELERARLGHQRIPDPIGTAVECLSQGKKVGWFQGRMEFGPRSLGARCILVDPRKVDPKEVKQRHQLKPFGISILETELNRYFHDPQPSPYMSMLGRIRYACRPALERILLNDFCRYQSVGPENRYLHELLSRFHRETGWPFLVNTSLNPEGEPIIDAPGQLLENLNALNLDVAVLNDILIERHA